MPSKKSFFNLTLFRKHLSRFWPLWGGVSLVGAMFPLYLQLALMQRIPGMVEESMVFRESMYSISVYFVPAFTCAYAILCVMAVWGYLYNARAVGLLHTLPVDRTCLFMTNTLAALAMVLIPYAVVGALVCLIALGWGFFDLPAVAVAVATVLLVTLLFAGMATLCAMLTGHGFVLPVFYLLFNFLAAIMEILITSLAHEFLMGVPMSEDLGRLTFLSPVLEIYSKFSVNYEHLDDQSFVPHLRGLGVVALYALVGAAMLALSWFLYKKRHSESAGDVVAFRWLRPVFRYGVALLSGLTVGRLLYEAMWRSLFQRGRYADALPMAVCLFLGGLIGYYGASMLLEKTLKVFHKKSLPGMGIVAAGAVALCLLVSVDVFGLERRVPALDEIESVTIMDRGDVSGPYSAAEDPDQAAALRAFHQAVVNDWKYIREYDPDWVHEEGRVFSHYIYLTYRLKDGSTLRREYRMWLAADRMETAGTYDNLLAAFYQDPVVRMREVSIPAGSELDCIDICCNYTDAYHMNTTDHAEGEMRETRQIYAALQKDAAEGNIPARDVLSYANRDSDFFLQIGYLTYNEYNSAYYSHFKTVYMTPSMTNTIDILVELGYLTEENVKLWEKNWAEWAAKALGEKSVFVSGA